MNENQTVSEKIYCYERPSNNDAALLAASLMNHNNNDNAMWPMMAMCSGGMGGQWLVYLMVMMMMRNGMWGNNGMWGINGQNAQNIELQNQIQSLRTQLSESQNTQLLRESIGDGFTRNDFALSQLAQNLNVDFNMLQKCCSDIQAAIQNVGGKVDMSAERVIAHAERGELNIISALKDCCCQNKELVQRMGYETQLGLKDVQFNTERGFCGLGREVMAGFDRTNTAIERAASAQAYESKSQTCDIINAGKENTQRIIDILSNHWNQEDNRRMQDLKAELSQERLLNRLLGRDNNGGCGSFNGCGQN